ncbi:MAG TPA: hypothetical protein VD963_08680 [Phycisphaerales bacterium]|nr:hypothetical protein [Phycisphaerales bacterium]
MNSRSTGSTTRRTARSGFALAELLTTVAVVAVAACVLLAAGAEPRRVGTLSGSMANLRQFAAGGSSFAADNQGFVWGYTWDRFTQASQWPDLNNHGGSDLQAAANQAVDIIRRLSGRTPATAPAIFSWVPHLLYAHLPLIDHLGEELPARWAISPADSQRLLWAGHHLSFPTGVPQPLPFGSPGTIYRWAYSSSYELGPAFFSNDARTATQEVVAQGSTHSTYTVPNGSLRRRLVSDVRHPSQKVMVYESHQRHFGPRVAYFAYPEARVPAQMGDGSVRVRATGEGNRGFNPGLPLSASPTAFAYQPQAYEPGTLNGQASQTVLGHYRWTRSGLRGRDFEGPEVPWVP